MVAFNSSYCSNKNNLQNKKITEKSDSIISFEEKKPVDSRTKVLEGAKENLKENAEYDRSMGYYVLRYKHGGYTGDTVYPGGDLDPKIGVCSDVIVRSLRLAGIVDLQKALYEDITSNKKDYPLLRGGFQRPDANIDHRRVRNLEVWFAKFWNKGDRKDFLPGDIVIWDLDGDGASNHIGIVSDKKEGQRYFVIHNHQDPGHIAEEDKLFKWKITGHYRIKD